MNAVLPIITTIITVLFAGLVYRRYAVRRKTYLFIWAIGLTLYGVGTGAEAYATFAWHPLAFRLWYLGGALLTAAWLGQGTIFLLVRKSYVASFLLWLLFFASLVAANELFNTPLSADRYVAGELLSHQYRAIMPPDALIRKFTPFFNVYGMLGLVGGAIYSAWLFWRKRVLLHRVYGNVFFALGGTMPGLGGTLSRFGLEQFLTPSQFVGVLLLFVGYMFSTRQSIPLLSRLLGPGITTSPVPTGPPQIQTRPPQPPFPASAPLPSPASPTTPASGREPLIIERDGQPVAALISIDEYREFEAWRAGRTKDSARYTLRRGNEIIDSDSDELALILRGTKRLE